MTLAELCVKRPVFAVMLITFLVVLGIFSFRDLGVDLFPKADPATVTITVRLPGATSEEVTTQVVLPLEEAISTISGLDELNSMASEGNARITCRFLLERELESAAQDVREKVAGAIRRLPPNILPPIIQKADPDSDPVISLVVAGDKTLRETTEIADKEIKRVLETVDGVGEVSMTGGRDRQIRIFADAEKLNAHNLTISQLQRAIQSENVEIPGGRIVRGDSELGVHLAQEFDLRRLEFLYYVPTSADTLCNSLHRLERYCVLANESIVIRLKKGRTARLRFEHVGVARLVQGAVEVVDPGVVRALDTGDAATLLFQ